MRTLFLFVFWISTIAIAHAADRPSHSSIADLILRETQEIHEAERHGAADLSLKYINRAESYIVAGKFEKALEDLEKGREAAGQRSQKSVEQRTLVDLMVAYAYLGDDENALSTTEHLKNSFNSSDNRNAKKGRLCKDENYVSGPDEEPGPGWCRQTVENTTKWLIDLLQRSGLRPGTQDSIMYQLLQLQNKGLICCERKNPWKSCVGTLAKKSLEWQSTGVPEGDQWGIY